MVKIFAVDCATVKSGYALIEAETGKVDLLEFGLIKAKGEMHERLYQLHTQILEKVREFEPDIVAFEDLKFNRHTKNLTSMTKVAYGIGAVQMAYAAADYKEVSCLTANQVRKIWGVTQKKSSLRAAINKKYAKVINDKGKPDGFKTADEDITDAIGLAVAVWVDSNK